MLFFLKLFFFINKFLLIILLNVKYTHADIVFEKNDILITNIELENYIDFLNQKNIDTNHNKAKKKYLFN
jgi:hypothetical protein